MDRMLCLDYALLCCYEISGLLLRPWLWLCVQDAFIPMDRESGRPRGFAFVTMSDSNAANSAVNALNQTEFGVSVRGPGARGANGAGTPLECVVRRLLEQCGGFVASQVIRQIPADAHATSVSSIFTTCVCLPVLPPLASAVMCVGPHYPRERGPAPRLRRRRPWWWLRRWPWWWRLWRR